MVYKDIPEFDRTELRIVKDFLPAPETIAEALKTRKVTIALSVSTIAFFKSQAHKLNLPYQRVVRELLDKYVTETLRRASA